MSEIDLANSLFGSKRLEGSTHHSTTSTLTGTAVSDSADGKVKVVIDGDSSASMPDGSDGGSVIELATSPAVQEGDSVLITAVGDTSKTMTVTSVVASGDRNRDQAVVSTLTEYAANQDPAAAPTSGWSQEQPEWTEGNYIWMRQTVTYGSGEVEFTEPACITGNAGAAGKDAILLHIDSSHGTVFKNADGKTTFTVTIFYGSKTITDKAGLTDAFGTSAHLEWKWLKVDEDDWGTIPASDSRLSNDGFTLAITSDDVDVKTSFECNLEY